MNSLDRGRQQKHGNAQDGKPRRQYCSSVAKTHASPAGWMQQFVSGLCTKLT
jgi:hypothetical protein